MRKKGRLFFAYFCEKLEKCPTINGTYRVESAKHVLEMIKTFLNEKATKHKMPAPHSISLWKSLKTALPLGALAFFTFLLLKITLVYLPYHTDVGFLKIKQQYLHIDHWRVAFFVHVYSSIFVLLAGFTQFSAGLRRRFPKLHRGMGYFYILDILFVTGPASLVMGFYANGHLPSRIGFVLLAIFWMFFTGRAWYRATKKDWTGHQADMMRSYALTLSAVTLRIWKLGLAVTLHPNPLDLYQMVTWLGFVPNWVGVEIYLAYFFRKNKKNNTPAPTAQDKGEGKPETEGHYRIS